MVARSSHRISHNIEHASLAGLNFL